MYSCYFITEHKQAEFRQGERITKCPHFACLDLCAQAEAQMRE